MLNVIRIRRIPSRGAVQIQHVLNDVYEILVLVVKEFQGKGSLGRRTHFNLSEHSRCGHCVICQRPQESSPEFDSQLPGQRPGGGYVKSETI